MSNQQNDIQPNNPLMVSPTASSILEQSKIVQPPHQNTSTPQKNSMAHANNTTEEEGVALSQAQMLQQQQRHYPSMMDPGASECYSNFRSHKSGRPVADQNAFMDTDAQTRRASWDKIVPEERAKQLEAEMLEKNQAS